MGTRHNFSRLHDERAILIILANSGGTYKEEWESNTLYAYQKITGWVNKYTIFITIRYKIILATNLSLEFRSYNIISMELSNEIPIFKNNGTLESNMLVQLQNCIHRITEELCD